MPKRTDLPRGIRLRGKTFQVDVTVDGKRLTGTAKSLDEAMLVQARLRAEAREGYSEATFTPSFSPVIATSVLTRAVAGKPWTLRQAIDKAFELPAPDGWAGGKSVKTNRINVEAAVNHFGAGTLLQDIDIDGLDGYVAALMRQGNSNATVNRKKSALSALMKIAKKRGGVTRIPDFPGRLAEPVGRIRQVSDEEEKQLLGLFTTWGKDDHADATIVLIETGMRLSELWNVEDRDVDLKGNVLMIYGVTGKGTKNGEFRSVPMMPRALAVMKGRLKNFKGKLFPYQNQWYRNQWDRARTMMGLDNDPQFVPHVLRHTCASRLVVTPEVTIPVVQKWLGHKTIQMTMRYSHLRSNDMAAAAQALASRLEREARA